MEGVDIEMFFLNSPYDMADLLLAPGLTKP